MYSAASYSTVYSMEGEALEGGGGDGTDALSLSTLNSHSLEQCGGTGVGGGTVSGFPPTLAALSHGGGGGAASLCHLPWPLTSKQLCNPSTH